MASSEVPSVLKRRRRGDFISGKGEEPSSMISENEGTESKIGVNSLSSQTTPKSSVGTGTSSSSSSSSSVEAATEDSFQNIIFEATRLDKEIKKLKEELASAQEKIVEKDAKIDRQNDKLTEAANFIKNLKGRLDVAVGKETEAEEKLAKLKDKLKSCFSEEFWVKFEDIRELCGDDEDQQRTSGQGQTAKRTVQGNAKLIKDNLRKHPQSADSKEAGGGDQSSPPAKQPALQPHPKSTNPGPPASKSSEAHTSGKITNALGSTTSEARHDMTMPPAALLAKVIPMQKTQPEPKILSTQLITAVAGQTASKITSKKTGEEGYVTVNNAEDISKSKLGSAGKKSAKEVGEPPLVSACSSSVSLPSFKTKSEINILQALGGLQSKDIGLILNLYDPDDDEDSFLPPLISPKPIPFTLNMDDVDDEDSRDPLKLRNQGPPVSISKNGQESTKISSEPVFISGNQHSMDFVKSKKGIFYCICGIGFRSRASFVAHIIKFQNKPNMESSSTCSPPPSKVLSGSVGASEGPQVAGSKRLSRRKQNLIHLPMDVGLPQMSTQPIPVIMQPSAAAASPSSRNDKEEDAPPKNLVLLHKVDTTKMGFHCTCQREFAYEKDLQMHIQRKYDNWKAEDNGTAKNTGAVLQNSNTKFTIEGQKSHGFDTAKLKLGSFDCICGKTYINKEKLQAHINYVERDLKFFCEICGKGFPFESLLTRHLRRSHKIGGDDDDDGREVNSTHKAKRQKSECTKCGKIFQTLTELLKHNKMVHKLTSFG